MELLEELRREADDVAHYMKWLDEPCPLFDVEEYEEYVKDLEDARNKLRDIKARLFSGMLVLDGDTIRPVI